MTHPLGWYLTDVLLVISLCLMGAAALVYTLTIDQSPLPPLVSVSWLLSTVHHCLQGQMAQAKQYRLWENVSDKE